MKVALYSPRPRQVRDVTSPEAVKAIWAEAEAVVREEAPVIRRRLRRAGKP